ncbi:MAG: hypothetical protein J6X00_03810 [Clostridia bacterium]|nr:hypothetical protein [Clostridia bacterium]
MIKKILALMTLCVIIVLGLVNVNSKINAFDSDAVYKTVTRDISLQGIECGDYVIVDYLINNDNVISNSIHDNNYVKLNNFFGKYDFTKVGGYVIDNAIVTTYYSPWFNWGNSNGLVEVADYGDNYVLGIPYIFEGY